MMMDYTNLDKIEQSTLDLVKGARLMRLFLLERELDKTREGLLLDLMQEYSEEDSIRIGKIIAGWQ